MPQPTKPGAELIQTQKDADDTFADDCAKAFDEVIALRKAVAESLVERSRNNAERAKAQVLISALDELVEVKNKQIEAHKQLEILLQGMIETQQKFIQFLSDQLLKPKKSVIQQIINGFKKAVEIIGFVGIGKLLGENNEKFCISTSSDGTRHVAADTFSRTCKSGFIFRSDLLAEG